jgi:hypothetical protein
MDDLFVVYRYLTHSRHTTDHQNPYNVAHRALDSYLDVEPEIAYYANRIRTTGGLTFEEAEKLTERIVAGFETGLNNYHGETLPAAIDFMKKYISLDDMPELIDACQQEQSRMQHEIEEEED